MLKKDSLTTGLISGIIMPVFGFLAYYLLIFRHQTLAEFIHYLQRFKLYAPTISISLIANGILFFIFLLMNADKSARGVLFATMFYGVIILALKVIYWNYS